MRFLWIYFLFVMQAAYSQDISINHCQASSTSCRYYSCVEDVVQCGTDGYLLHFGEAKCEAYLKNQKIASPTLQKWYPQVRRCLQLSLTKILNQKEGPNNCQQLKAAAFQSHFDCYVQTGFCDLSWFDRITIGSVAGLSLFGKDAVQTSLALNKACSQL